MFEKIINFFRPKKYRRDIIVNVEKLETRVAVMEKGRLEEFMVEHPDDERLVGCIFRGRVQNLQDDLQAAFVDIGLKKNAFLHYWDMTPDCDALLDEADEDENPDPKNGGKKTSSQAKSKRKPPRLSNEEIHKRYPEGSEITVMVTKGPISTKGPRVTTNLSIAGRYLVMMPGQTLRGVSKKVGDAQERQRLKKVLDRLMIPSDVGVIARTASVGAKPKVIARDMRNLIESWRELQGNIKNLRVPCCVYREPGLVEQVVRDWLTEDIDSIIIDDKKTFEEMREVTSRISRRARNKIRLHEDPTDVFEQYGVDKQLADAFQRKVPLKSGGYLVIDETEALIAVDVNTGHYKVKDGKTKEKEGKNLQEESILQVNLEAVEEVARQLRLRNIGGLVVLDLIDMKSRKHRKQVYQALKGFLKRDRSRPSGDEPPAESRVDPLHALDAMPILRRTWRGQDAARRVHRTAAQAAQPFEAGRRRKEAVCAENHRGPRRDAASAHRGRPAPRRTAGRVQHPPDIRLGASPPSGIFFCTGRGDWTSAILFRREPPALMT